MAKGPALFRVALTSAAAATLLIAATLADGAPAGPTEAVLALDAERCRAMAAGDVAALERIFALDAVYTHANGVSEDRSELIASIRSGARRYTSFACRDARARSAGGAVVVSGRVGGSVEAGGKTIPLSLVYTAVYAESAGRWRLVAYQSTTLPETGKKEVPLPHTASGAFEVQMVPQKTEEGSALSRFSLDKKYSGGLEGSSRGEMLAAGTAVPNSAGYVAFEKFTGTVDGRSGTFILQHSATMTRGDGKLSITVVPDSGTGALTGLTGSMSIRIEAGKHFYDFEYSIP